MVGSSFDLSARTAAIQLYNLKTKNQTTLPIKLQSRPTHKIELFVRKKICFGICLNRGEDMHVFGIYWCQLHMFKANVKVAAQYISGILFYKKDQVLIYGAENYNMLFKIKY